MSDHANHIGSSAGACPLRITVNAHPYGMSSNGYACSVTGGHCIPSDVCDQRNIDADKQTKLYNELAIQ
jgi:hypothetical protein